MNDGQKGNGHDPFKLSNYIFLLPANDLKDSKITSFEKSLIVLKLSGKFMNDLALNLTLLSDVSSE